ncbi:MAG: DUF2207 domain-containing protein [Clostridiales bacterium]|nr:DUF2207 domain-containing protein [Clostridiales bacterium]
MKRTTLSGAFARPAAALLALLLALALFTPALAAGETDSIQITVDLQSNGDAVITEVWSLRNVSDVTEWCFALYNLTDASVDSLTVHDELGRQYETLDAWNVNASRAEKEFRCGIATTSEGYEICWGVEFGTHTYTIRYTLRNLVKGYQDGAGFNHMFISAGDPLREASVLIGYEGVPLEDGNADIWGFGNSVSELFFTTDGRIFAGTTAAFSSSDSMIVLCRFVPDLFSPAVVYDRSVDDLVNRALEGSDYGDRDDDYGGAKPPVHPGTSYPAPSRSPWRFAAFGLFPILVVAITGFAVASLLRSARTLPTDGGGRQSLPSLSKADYSRDLPFGGDLLATYYTLKKVGRLPSETSLLGCYLLRWSMQGHLQVEERERRGLFGRDSSSVVLFPDRQPDLPALELELYNMLLSAAGSNRVLEEKELQRWSQRNHSRITGWETSAAEAGRRALRAAGDLAPGPSRTLLGFIPLSPPEVFTEQGFGRAVDTIGFWKYLKDFTIINERRAVEVDLWDDYLVFAVLFGIAEQVAKEFKDLYPGYFEQPHTASGTGRPVFVPYGMIYSASRMSQASRRGVQAAQQTSSSFSGGGGGFSGGGGGGFSGGGGRGGR